MTLEPITCNNCGAALDVPPEANYVTCAYCGSRLEVKRTPSVVYTQVLQQLDARTQRLSADVSQLQLDRELAQIDRDWEQQRQRYLLRDRTGATIEPGGPLTAWSVGLTVIGIVVLTVFAFVWPGMLAGEYGEAFFLIALAFVGLMIWGTVTRISQVTNYQRAKRAYEARRSAVVQRVMGQ